MLHRRLLPFLLLAACSQPTEYARDNPIDPTGASFELPGITGLASTRVGRHIRLAWTTPFNRYTIHIERSKNGGAFELRDTLQSNITSWTDTHVTLPDSAIYRYRVFGTYLDRSTDTLLSHRITSVLETRHVNQLVLGASQFTFFPWTTNPLGSIINGSLQTFHVEVDSLSVWQLYENGSLRYFRKMATQAVSNPRDTLSYRLVLNQHSRGREVRRWTSPFVDSGSALDGEVEEEIRGFFPDGFPHLIRSDGRTLFLYNVPNQTISVAYEPVGKVHHYITRSSTDPIRSVARVSDGRFLYVSAAGKVRSVVLSQGMDTPIAAPEPATVVSAYYETGELVYVRSRTGEAAPATLDRFNIFSQTPILSVPIETARPHMVLDRPDLNQIWVFHRGLMRIDRTTGAVLQAFESTEPIGAVMFRAGKAYASFTNSAPYVATYDMATGAATVIPIPFRYLEALFFTDGVHIAYRTETALRVHNLHRGTHIASMDGAIPSLPSIGFIPLATSSPDLFHFAGEFLDYRGWIHYTKGPFSYTLRAEP